MRLQAYAKVHDTKLKTSKEVENRWNCDVYIYAMCTSLCLCVHCAHICNVHIAMPSCALCTLYAMCIVHCAQTVLIAEGLQVT